MTRRAATAAVLLLATLLVACGRDRLRPGEARLVVDGRAQVAEPDGPFRVVRGTRRLHTGDRVRVAQGAATIELSDDRSLELRRGSSVTVRDPLYLLTGDSLAKAAGTALSVRTGMTDVIVRRGVSRVSSALAVRAASYTGGLDVDSAGRRLHVPALRQTVVATPGLVPDRALPIAYEPTDAWDRRYLGDAIDLGGELAIRSRGFAAQTAPPAGTSPATFFRQLLPALVAEPAFDDGRVDPARSYGETLVGTAIAVRSEHGPFAERWASVFGFRDDGADWGIVARDQGVDRAPLLADLDEAIARAATPFGDASAPIVQDGQPTPTLPLGAPPAGPPPPGTTTTTRRGTRPPPTTTTTLPSGLTIPTVTIPQRGKGTSAH